MPTDLIRPQFRRGRTNNTSIWKLVVQVEIYRNRSSVGDNILEAGRNIRLWTRGARGPGQRQNVEVVVYALDCGLGPKRRLHQTEHHSGDSTMGIAATPILSRKHAAIKIQVLLIVIIMNSAGSERSLVADMDHNKRKRSEGNERSEEDELSIKRERSEDGGGVEEKVKGEEKAEHKTRINNKYHFKKAAKKVKKRRRRQGHRHRHRHRHNPLRGSAHENTSQRSSSATANRRHPNVSSIFRYCQLKTPPLSPPGLVNDWPRTPYPYLDMHTPPNGFPNFDFPPFNPIAFRNSRGKRVRLTLPATTSDRENEHKVPSDITSDQENQHKVPSEITWDRENEHKVPSETENEIQEKSL